MNLRLLCCKLKERRLIDLCFSQSESSNTWKERVQLPQFISKFLYGVICTMWWKGHHSLRGSRRKMLLKHKKKKLKASLHASAFHLCGFVDFLCFELSSEVFVKKKRCHFLPWETMMDTFHHFKTYFRGYVWIHNSSSSKKFSPNIHFKETSASVQRHYWQRWLKKAQLFRASRCFVELNVCFYRKSFHYLRNHCTINVFLSCKNPSDLI